MFQVKYFNLRYIIVDFKLFAKIRISFLPSLQEVICNDFCQKMNAVT